MNSGLKVIRMRTGAALINGIILLTSSSELESIQCVSASWSNQRSFVRKALEEMSALSAAIVRSFCRCGVKRGNGSSAGGATDNNAAYKEISS